MDVISLGKATQALNKIKNLDQNIVAPLAENRFPTVDARLDWLEGQAAKIKAENSKQVDLLQGTLTNTEVVNGKVQLKKVGTTGSGYTNDLVPVMTSNTAPSGQVSASSDVYGTPYKIFDNGDTYGWTANATTGWIQYKFASSTKIDLYTLKPRSGASINQAPKSWTFEGSNDGLNWTVLDIKTNITDWAIGVAKEFPIQNNISYLYYRLNVSANNGDTFYLNVGDMEMKQSVTQNQYSPSGTWESPIIDLGEGWINTSLVDVVKQIATPTTDISLEVASSQDGMSFTNYESLDPTTPPQARYVKIRASLSAQAGAGEATNLDFNNQDPQNTFTLDDKLVADGQLKFKTSYTSAMTNEGAVGTGTVLSAVIDKTQFKSIEKVSVN